MIKVKCLKDVLSLFDGDECLVDLILGDTWRPSLGFVAESILDGKRAIKDILDFDYDFDGLVEFQANIGSLKVHLLADLNDKCDLESYAVFGTNKGLYKLYNRAIERNAYCPDKYQLHFMKEWE